MFAARRITVVGQFEEKIPQGLKPVSFELTHYSNLEHPQRPKSESRRPLPGRDAPHRAITSTIALSGSVHAPAPV
jgi:hypothetical protein